MIGKIAGIMKIILIIKYIMKIDLGFHPRSFILNRREILWNSPPYCQAAFQTTNEKFSSLILYSTVMKRCLPLLYLVANVTRCDNPSTFG